MDALRGRSLPKSENTAPTWQGCLLSLALSLSTGSLCAQTIMTDGFENLPVTIVLAGGDVSAAEGCYFAGDAQSDARGCTLYQLQVTLPNAQVQQVQAITTTALGGAWQPTVANGQLAYTRRLAAGIEIRKKDLSVLDPNDPGQLWSPAGLWVWPNLAESGTLHVSRSQPLAPECVIPSGPQAGTCTSVQRWSESARLPTAGSSTLVAGNTRFSFEDSWSLPGNAGIIAGHGKYRESGSTRPDCSVSCADITPSPMPIVLETASGKYQILALASHEFSGGGPAAPLAGCAHAAWSPDGSALLCTEQGTASLAALGLQSRIYRVPFSASAFAAGSSGIVPTIAEPLFTHRLPEAVFPLTPGQSCDVFHHKYAEWCGDDRHVIATIGCAMDLGGGLTSLLYDRVFLIDITNPLAPLYTDLITPIEMHRGLSPYAMTGFTGTCARPTPGPI